MSVRGKMPRVKFIHLLLSDGCWRCYYRGWLQGSGCSLGALGVGEARGELNVLHYFEAFLCVFFVEEAAPCWFSDCAVPLADGFLAIPPAKFDIVRTPLNFHIL